MATVRGICTVKIREIYMANKRESNGKNKRFVCLRITGISTVKIREIYMANKRESYGKNKRDLYGK